jgi:hypothetical protein
MCSSAGSARLRVVLLLLAGSIAACGAPQDEVPTTDEDLINGEQTLFWPAVGVSTLNGGVGCSGTLVAPNVVLVAAHCFEPGRTEVAPWKFKFERNGKSYLFETGAGWVLGGANAVRGAGEDDLALIRLKTSVPSSVARPLELANLYPASGAEMQIVGYGCTDRVNGGGQGVKRRFKFKWGESTSELCPNDSGGALIEAKSGRIVGVNSGFYRAGTGNDIFAWVPKHYDTLVKQIANLRR